jgi:hypothetical protein
MRGARPALIRRHDHAEAALPGKLQRALLLDAKLGTEDVHGAALGGWTKGDARLPHHRAKPETILGRKRRCQE